MGCFKSKEFNPGSPPVYHDLITTIISINKINISYTNCPKRYNISFTSKLKHNATNTVWYQDLIFSTNDRNKVKTFLSSTFNSSLKLSDYELYLYNELILC